MTHAAPDTTTVPDIWYKAQRVLRTVVAVIISVAGTFAAAVTALSLVAPQVLDELAKVLPASWVAWLSGALAFLVVLAGVITRIMAIPGVNAFLTKIGLGSVPKSAVIDGGTVKADTAAVITSLPATTETVPGQLPADHVPIAVPPTPAE